MGITRFRAYQLGESGSSFSYCHGGHFTLIEARLTKSNVVSIVNEINNYGGGKLDVLHITSWDKDHCNPSNLQNILDNLKPQRVECPGYSPETEFGYKSLEILKQYHEINSSVQDFTPLYIKNLDNAEEKKTNDVVYWPKEISGDCPNDNSTVKLFRRGHFTVLSLGDIDSNGLLNKIIVGNIIRKEVDVMILAHHGADNGFTCQELIDSVKPKVAICTSNYDSQYSHPKEEIRNLLYDNNIPLFTTKTGDVIIQNDIDNPKKFEVFNLISDSKKISPHSVYTAKNYFI